VKTGEKPNTKMSCTSSIPQTMANVRLGPVADFCINSVESYVVLTKSEVHRH
jgi:hypothetical protein